MNFGLKTMILLLVATVFHPGISQTKIEKEQHRLKQIEVQVDAYVNNYLTGGNFSGSILVARDGKVLLTKGYGMANYEDNVANSPKTKFHIASLSKSFTAAAILVLQEQGRVDVNDAISKFLPGYPNGDTITIHHLLTHSSGVPDINRLPAYSLQSRFQQTPESLISIFKDKTLSFKPGEKYGYSNSNYILLAYIIEKISGRRYGEFLMENIFGPLGMNDTGHDGSASKLISGRAQGYIPAVGLKGIGNAPFLDWSSKTGNGSLYSTVEDLYRWDRALYTDKILKKATLERMFTKHIETTGYGFFIGKRFSRDVVYMNGSSPGFNSFIARYTNDDVCIIVLANNDVQVATKIGTAIAAMLFGESYEQPKMLKGVKLSPVAIRKVTGRYRFDYGFEVNIRENQQGLYFNAVYPEYDVPLIPLSEKELFNRFYWDSLILEEDERGTISRLYWANDPINKAQKVGQ